MNLLQQKKGEGGGRGHFADTQQHKTDILYLTG